MDPDPVGVRRARAGTQLLDRPVRSAATVVERLVGVQAQDDRAAALAIRARTTGLTAADVTRGVADGTFVVTWTLRGTRHLHLREDVPWLLALFGPLYSRPTKRDADLGIAGPVGERAVATLRQVLDNDGSLTRAEVKERLAPVGVDPTGQAAIHVIRRAALAGVLSVVPGDDQRGKERYAALQPPPSTSDGATELARRYVRGYGPATPEDFAAWSGLGLQAAKAAWPRRATRMAADDTAAPLRLLGGFDNLLLGYADRTPHLAPEHAKAVNAGGGMIKPVVVDDGRVVGTWTPGDGTTHPFPGERFDPTGELEDVRRFQAD